MCMVSLDSVWAWVSVCTVVVAALTITPYQSDPACHYLVACNVVRGLRSYMIIIFLMMDANCVRNM